MNAVLPTWARWNETAGERPFSVGVEEEVMLIGTGDWNLASRVDDVLTAAQGTELFAHLTQETHGSAVELRSDPYDDPAGAVAQLDRMRAALRVTLEPLGLAPAAAGTHPFATWHDVHVSAGERQQELLGAMRELARREPTFALHVHVAVADPETAVRAMNRMRVHVPLLLALSANSPFWQGRDSGLASARTPLFQAFPRAGLPRCFDDYESLVSSTDLLIRSGAIREPSFIWWDVRLQPRYGTLEVRVMDTQTSLRRTAGLVELVHALVRAECEPDGLAATAMVSKHEALDENRFRALRDGCDASFIDADGDLVSVEQVLSGVLEACGPLPAAERLMDDPGANEQRASAHGPRGLISLVQDLVSRF
jgi:glutamate---cysteine ligase / carboxylate-amine ligase